uniref:Uncharacterized protein n=1 Tax=Pithovirus LCPAC401 TaxID=2506595 RepID=A0A481Z9T6_9VIRU|nr:MAG: hypothetical protein LCPAC401_00240 [Pithovirus LCPAC401]
MIPFGTKLINSRSQLTRKINQNGYTQERKKPIKLIHQVSVNVLEENKRPAEDANVKRDLHGLLLMKITILLYNQNSYSADSIFDSSI